VAAVVVEDNIVVMETKNLVAMMMNTRANWNEQALKLCQFKVMKVARAEEAAETVQAAIDMAYSSSIAVAVLLSQKMLGRKQWTK
jgi:sulfopyruvate decarboxylase TPP-binding subunit